MHILVIYLEMAIPTLLVCRSRTVSTYQLMLNDYISIGALKYCKFTFHKQDHAAINSNQTVEEHQSLPPMDIADAQAIK